MSKPVRFVFGLHLHQPVGNFDQVFADHLRDVYRPFLEHATKANFLPLTVHLSGPLLEWLDAHEPMFLDTIGELAGSGRLELLLAGFDEPILASLPRVDRIEQISRMREFLKRRFGVDARGLWLTERVWEPELAADLHDAGVGYALLDDRHFLVTGFRRRDLHQPYRTESDGRGIALLAIDERLRYLIPFRPPEETAQYLRDLRTAGHELAVLADDGEKFGGWPGTKEWVYEKGWLDRFLAVLGRQLADGEVKLITGAEAVRDVPSAGLAYLPTASYREMEGWSLPTGAQSRLLKFEEELGTDRMAGPEGSLIRGGHWRNFLVKYAESNRLHKTMVALSTLCRERGDPPAARRAIGRAQCNDAYWHGVFGGLYLPHLRQGLWKNLCIAERELRAGEPVGFETRDIDGDGFDEIWIHSAAFSAIVSPRRGGSIQTLLRFAEEANLADALTRRREAYHEAALAAGQQKHKESHEEGGAPSIHDIEKAARLNELPPADLDLRAIFVDRVLYGDLPERSYTRAGYEPARTWANVALVPDVRIEGDRAVVVMKGAGLEKTLTFHASGRVGARWTWSTEGLPADAFFAPELSLSKETALELDPPVDVWTIPITTVSKSERGLEETTQGVSYTPRWPVTLGKAGIVIPV